MKRPIKLNLGCGNDLRDNAINIDLRLLPVPNGHSYLRADVSDLDHYFEPECADEIWAIDVFEHVPRPLSKATIESWARLLIPGGVLYLRTPDLTRLAEKVIDPNVSDDHAAWLIYGGQGHVGAYHRAGFTEGMLRRLLIDAGLRVAKLSRYEQETNIFIKAVKDGNPESPA